MRADFWSGAHYLDDVATLNKAGLVLAGRRPTPAEQAAVYAGGEAELRRTLRRMLDGPEFEAFVRETANDHLLTDKYLIHQSNAFGVLQGEYQYPDLYERIEVLRAIYGDDAAWDAWEKTNRALAREPLELFAYIVRNERPYTEIVTADYFMVNPWSNSVYRGGADFGNDWGEENWKRGSNRGYRLARLSARRRADVTDVSASLPFDVDQPQPRAGALGIQVLSRRRRSRSRAARDRSRRARRHRQPHAQQPQLHGLSHVARSGRGDVPGLRRPRHLPRERHRLAAVELQEHRALPLRRSLVSRHAAAGLQRRDGAGRRFRRRDRVARAGDRARPALRARRGRVLVQGHLRPRSAGATDGSVASRLWAALGRLRRAGRSVSRDRRCVRRRNRRHRTQRAPSI